MYIYIYIRGVCNVRNWVRINTPEHSQYSHYARVMMCYVLLCLNVLQPCQSQLRTLHLQFLSCPEICQSVWCELSCSKRESAPCRDESFGNCDSSMRKIRKKLPQSVQSLRQNVEKSCIKLLKESGLTGKRHVSHVPVSSLKRQRHLPQPMDGYLLTSFG